MGHEVDWSGATPVSRRFGDPFFSLQDGLAETRHVFLDGNGLPARFRDGFSIAELGFGTGLNLLSTVRSWRDNDAPGRLSYTSFEEYPLSAGDLAAALAPFEGLDPAPLIEAWHKGLRRFDLGPVAVEVIEGDARERLPDWAGRADAWFLDGFAPARNPEMWGEALMAEVARHTVAGGTFATYSAAGQVRRALAAAGFEVRRVPGYGRKRHMTQGRLPPA